MIYEPQNSFNAKKITKRNKIPMNGIFKYFKWLQSKTNIMQHNNTSHQILRLTIVQFANSNTPSFTTTTINNG